MKRCTSTKGNHGEVFNIAAILHRVDAGGTPACVEACSAEGHGAMIFGDLKDPNSEISKRLAEFPSIALRDDLQLDPGVRYSNL